MSHLMLKLAVGLGLAVGLAACHDDGSATNVPVVTPPTSPPPAARFASLGAGFAADFAANPNTNPAAVTASDVTPVNNTALPIPVT